MISVVIPLYNKERHIAHTISTVLNQTYSDFELIVMDDGSTDKSAEIVSQIDDKRIKLVRKQNEGLAKTRNKGAEIAKSELIAFLDADDEWESEFLENIVMLSKNYPEAVLYGTNYNVVERNGKRYSLDFPDVPNNGEIGLIKNYFISAYDYTPFNSSSVCIRKSIMKEFKGFRSGNTAEDLDLWCRVALKYPIAYVNKTLSTYRRDSDNMLTLTYTKPSLFPFLFEYDSSKNKAIKDEASIEKYILQKQLSAATTALFYLKDKNQCKEIMKQIRFYKWNKKKYYLVLILQLFPQKVIDVFYSVRKQHIETFD